MIIYHVSYEKQQNVEMLQDKPKIVGTGNYTHIEWQKTLERETYKSHRMLEIKKAGN